MKSPTRKPNRADVARSLRELEKLFGRKRPPNENALREQGVDAAEIKLRTNDTTKNGGAI